jgi:membrane associated rhomboid family serine protease
LEWITALSAAGMDYRLSRREGRWVLHVPREHSLEARREIEAYERVNAGWPPSEAPELPARGGPYRTWASAWGAVLLAGFHVWMGPYDPTIPYLRAASADAAGIVAGEWWRVVTALTLHSGVVHLAGNALCLLLVGHAVCRLFGGGVGWLLMLGSGVAGNAAVAWIFRTEHISVGASTSSFGAIGVLVAYRAWRSFRRYRDWRSIWGRTWIPVGAGLALLALLGTGPQSDLAAHGLGFLFGILFSLPLCVAGTRWVPEWAQRLLEMGCLLLVMAAWSAAARP